MDKVFTYSQTTGIMRDENGDPVAHGWAGNGKGRNNPAMQAVHDVGPLPQGRYKVGPWEDVHPHLGPIVAHLSQIGGDTFGRSAFYIHGPSMDPARYGQESKGCIVVPRPERLGLRELAPDFVDVTA